MTEPGTRGDDGPPIVLFLCTHNAGRSQMALGWFNHLAGDRAIAWSGGSEPGTELNPAAIAVMAEVGIDITTEYPKPWTEEIVRAAELAAAGADIVDVGGESTRPGSDPVEEGDELGRVVPMLEGLAGLQAAISIDTRKACVARAAARAGATIFNDVTALTYDPDSLAAAADTGLSVILMHAKGEPKTMHLDPRYDDVVLEVYDYLEGRIAAAEAVGIERARIAADPGIGFGKTMDHTLALLANLSLLHGLGVPILVGASRKRFIGGVAGGETPQSREPGSFAVALAAAAQGAQILRVHDVAGTRQALSVWQGCVAGTGA